MIQLEFRSVEEFADFVALIRGETVPRALHKAIEGAEKTADEVVAVLDEKK